MRTLLCDVQSKLSPEGGELFHLNTLMCKASQIEMVGKSSKKKHKKHRCLSPSDSEGCWRVHAPITHQDSENDEVLRGLERNKSFYIKPKKGWRPMCLPPSMGTAPCGAHCYPCSPWVFGNETEGRCLHFRLWNEGSELPWRAALLDDEQRTSSQGDRWAPSSNSQYFLKIFYVSNRLNAEFIL